MKYKNVKPFHFLVSEVDSSIFESVKTIVSNSGHSQNRMANSVDSDLMAHYEHYEPSDQDLHCLQKHCFDLQD